MRGQDRSIFFSCARPFAAICSGADGSSHRWSAPLRLAPDVPAPDTDHRWPQCARPCRGGRLGSHQRRVLVPPHAFHGPRRELDRRRRDRGGAQRSARASTARALVGARAVRTVRLVRTARLVWAGLLELAGLAPDEELEDGVLAAGSEAVLDTPRLAAAIDELLASADRREQLHRLIARLLAHGEEVLGRWANVMVNSGTYAEIVDRHVELYSRLYWWGSVLDESDPLEEHLNRPRLSRISPATQASGPIEDEWLRDNLVAIAQLAESLDRSSFELAMRIVPFEWWTAQLPDRPSTVENHRR